jgi:hypothetical protein
MFEPDTDYTDFIDYINAEAAKIEHKGLSSQKTKE